MGGKTILEFYPLDVEYQEKGIIVVFGVTKEGERVVVLDSSFSPYFYAIVENEKKESVLNNIIKSKVETDNGFVSPTKVNLLERNLVGNPVNAVKIEFRTNKELKQMKEGIRKIEGVTEIVEDDIPPAKKYLLDKKLRMLTRVRVKGNIVENKDYDAEFIISADEIEEIGGEIQEIPKILAIDIETYNPIGNPRPKKDPIIMISLSSNYGLNKVITWKRVDGNLEYVETVDSELDLLNKLVEIIKKEKPHIIVGYNSDNFDFPYIVERAKRYKIGLPIGIDKSDIRITKRGIGVAARIRGISHIDLYTFIRNIFGANLKTETYDLNSVASELINEQKVNGFHWTEISEMWDSGGEDLKKIAEYSMKDAVITLKLAGSLFNIITELTRIVGQSLFDVSRMTYGQCVEWFLAKHADEFKELIPKKPVGSFVSNKPYEGGYVKEPKPGLYENIVVYDFRSLYPSIIVSYNVCPTTLFCDCCKNGYIANVDGKEYMFCKNKKGFIPSLLENLIERRVRIKTILKSMDKNSVDYNILSARSYAIKTISNAMYGYFGFARSRWYCWECAASITSLGRKYIKEVIEKAEAGDYNVIYADTDSLFIELKDKSLEDANKFIEKINERLPKLMELEFQGFYPRGLFVAKKRYALSDTLGNLTVKGLEWVRRDWSKIAKDTQINVLKTILVEGSIKKAVEIVKETIKNLKEGKLPIEEVTIYTQLTRKIEDYESIGPHVSAAIKARDKGYTFEPGQIIKYVIVKGSGSISDKAFILEEVLERKLEYDPEYYINNQVLPAVERIFDVVGISRDELLGKVQTTLGGFFK